jgi:uncharacterized protein (TIGR01244 family)
MKEGYDERVHESQEGEAALRRPRSRHALKAALVVLVATGAFLAPAGLRAELPEEAPAGISGYHLAAPAVAVGGAPSRAALEELRKAGLKTVIDMRTEAEGTKTEEAVARELGLRYVAIPVTPASFSVADADAVRKVLDDAGAGPVLVHCASGNRVGGVFAVIESLKGKTPDAALAEGRRLGLHSDAMIEAVRRVTSDIASPKEP